MVLLLASYPDAPTKRGTLSLSLAELRNNYRLDIHPDDRFTVHRCFGPASSTHAQSQATGLKPLKLRERTTVDWPYTTQECNYTPVCSEGAIPLPAFPEPPPGTTDMVPDDLVKPKPKAAAKKKPAPKKAAPAKPKKRTIGRAID